MALVLTGLSLSHLARGTEIITGSEPAASWAMAIGLDLAFGSLEVALLYAQDKARREVSRFAVPAIIGTLAMSGAMNALSFSEHSEGFMLWPAIGLGLAIPALVYALTRAGAVLYRVSSCLMTTHSKMTVPAITCQPWNQGEDQ